MENFLLKMFTSNISKADFDSGNYMDKLPSTLGENEKNFLMQLNSSYIDSIFTKYDTDNNGTITQEEYNIFQSQEPTNTESVEINKEDFVSILGELNTLGAEIEAIFDALDTNNDGVLQGNEADIITGGLVDLNADNLREVLGMIGQGDTTVPEVSEEAAPIEEPEVPETAPVGEAPVEQTADVPTDTAPVADVPVAAPSSGGGGSGGNYNPGSNTTQFDTTPTANTTEAKINELESKKVTAQSDMESGISAEEASLKQIMAEDEKLDAEAIENFEKENQRIDTDLAQVNETINIAESVMIDIDVNIADTNSRIEWKSTQIGEFEGAISEKNAELANLQQAENPDSSAISTLQSAISDLTGKKDQAQAEKTELETQLTSLESEKAEIQEGLNTLLTARGELEQEKANLMTSMSESASPETAAAIAQVQENINKLKTEGQDAINKINNELSALKTQMAEEVLEVDKAKESSQVHNVGEIPAFVREKDAKVIEQLHPMLQSMVIDLYNRANEQGLDFTISDLGNLRTLGYQEDKNSENSKRYGKPNPFGTSGMHVMGLALDFTPGKGTSYEQIAGIAKDIGFRWAPDFRSDGGEPWHIDIGNIVGKQQGQMSEREWYEAYPSIKKLGDSYETTEFYTYDEIKKKGY